MAQAVTAREAISAAKRTPTNANIVEAIERLYDGPDGLAGLSDRMKRVETDVGKLLHHFGLTSGPTP